MRLVHISDLHFGHHDHAVYTSLSADITAQAPALVVASGDFTQLGTRAEFEMARAFLRGLQVPFFAVPGNHDLGRAPLRRFLSPYAHYRQYISADVEPYLELPGVAIAGLNTTRRALADRDWSNGSINRHQLAGLAEVFARTSPEAVRVVVAHHPLMRPEGLTAKPTRAVRRSALALEALSSLGVRLVLSGHFHLSFVRRYDPNAVREGIPRGPRQAAAVPILVAQASSTISTRLRGESNAYNIVDIDDGQITIHVREWLDGAWETRETASAAS